MQLPEFHPKSESVKKSNTRRSRSFGLFLYSYLGISPIAMLSPCQNLISVTESKAHPSRPARNIKRKYDDVFSTLRHLLSSGIGAKDLNIEDKIRKIYRHIQDDPRQGDLRNAVYRMDISKQLIRLNPETWPSGWYSRMGPPFLAHARGRLSTRWARPAFPPIGKRSEKHTSSMLGGGLSRIIALASNKDRWAKAVNLIGLIVSMMCDALRSGPNIKLPKDQRALLRILCSIQTTLGKSRFCSLEVSEQT